MSFKEAGINAAAVYGSALAVEKVMGGPVGLMLVKGVDPKIQMALGDFVLTKFGGQWGQMVMSYIPFVNSLDPTLQVTIYKALVFTALDLAMKMPPKAVLMNYLLKVAAKNVLALFAGGIISSQLSAFLDY